MHHASRIVKIPGKHSLRQSSWHQTDGRAMGHLCKRWTTTSWLRLQHVAFALVMWHYTHNLMLQGSILQPISCNSGIRRRRGGGGGDINNNLSNNIVHSECRFSYPHTSWSMYWVNRHCVIIFSSPQSYRWTTCGVWLPHVDYRFVLVHGLCTLHFFIMWGLLELHIAWRRRVCWEFWVTRDDCSITNNQFTCIRLVLCSCLVPEDVVQLAGFMQSGMFRWLGTLGTDWDTYRVHKHTLGFTSTSWAGLRRVCFDSVVTLVFYNNIRYDIGEYRKLIIALSALLDLKRS